MTGKTSLEMTTGACTLHKEVLRTGSLRSLTPWTGLSYKKASSLSHPWLYLLQFFFFFFFLLTSCSQHGGHQRGERQESHNADIQDEDTGVQRWVTGAKTQLSQPTEQKMRSHRSGPSARREAARRARWWREAVGQDLLLPEAQVKRIVAEKAAPPLPECLGRERRQ